ncbi:protein kinase [Streptomyces nogalater]
MELVDGPSLAERIARDGPVDAVEAARIGIALLSAVHTAHEAGVLHRDIKPANVLIESGTDRVVLTDFGIAQVEGATTLTETGSFVGSPEYTAPERMAGLRTGPESDLWSLGALLCTVLSGESPFRRDSLGGILHAVVSAEIRPPAQAEPLLPVVLGLLERDPDRRLGAADAERMLRTYLETGRTPAAPGGYGTAGAHGVGRLHRIGGRIHKAPVSYSPTRPDLPQGGPPPPGPAHPTAQPPPARPRAGCWWRRCSSPRWPGRACRPPRCCCTRAGTRAAAPRAARPPPRRPAPARPPPVRRPPRRCPGLRPLLTRYRLAHRALRLPHGPRPGRLLLAVPEGFTRSSRGERVFYLSPGQTFRLGVKVTGPQPGGPRGVLERSAAAGPENNPGYHDGRVTPTTHAGHRAAFWEFTWTGFSAAEGPRHTFDLCWEENGRLYDVWVSAPVGKVREAREYFDVAVDTFAAAGESRPLRQRRGARGTDGT